MQCVLSGVPDEPHAKMVLQECQQQADKEFLTFVVFPGLAATAGLIALLLRPPPSGDQYFQDPDTQMVFEVPKDAEVGRDKKVNCL